MKGGPARLILKEQNERTKSPSEITPVERPLVYGRCGSNLLLRACCGGLVKLLEYGLVLVVRNLYDSARSR